MYQDSTSYETDFSIQLKMDWTVLEYSAFLDWIYKKRG